MQTASASGQSIADGAGVRLRWPGAQKRVHCSSNRGRTCRTLPELCEYDPERPDSHFVLAECDEAALSLQATLVYGFPPLAQGLGRTGVPFDGLVVLLLTFPFQMPSMGEREQVCFCSESLAGSVYMQTVPAREFAQAGRPAFSCSLAQILTYLRILGGSKRVRTRDYGVFVSRGPTVVEKSAGSPYKFNDVSTGMEAKLKQPGRPGVAPLTQVQTDALERSASADARTTLPP